MIRALKPVVVKEFRQIRRDPTSLGMLLVLPAALILLVGYAMNFDVRHIPLVVYDQSRTPESRALLEKFRRTEYFDILGEVAGYPGIEELFLRNTARAAIVIPRHFARDLAAGRTVRVQLLLDGADANSAGQAVVYAAGITLDHSSDLRMEALRRVRGNSYEPIDFRPRVWYNPDLRSSRFLVTGLIGFILVLTAVVSTSLTVVREKERGTMEQITVSPLSPLHIVLGKTIPYLLISLVAASVVLLAGYLAFDVAVRGSLLLLYAAVLIIILAALGQGLLISTVTDSQQVAFMISVFSSLLPSFLLSGFIFPVSSMPVVLQVLSNLAVTKFFIVIARGVMLKGVGIEAVWEQFLAMLLFAAVTLGVSAARMRPRRGYAS
jgi:ABC-2 type transport system permease protein